VRQFAIDAPGPSEGYVRLSNHAQLVVKNLGVVVAFIGQGLDGLFNDFKAQASDLTPSPPSGTARHWTARQAGSVAGSPAAAALPILLCPP
jgi:hypothetical protein